MEMCAATSTSEPSAPSLEDEERLRLAQALDSVKAIEAMAHVALSHLTCALEAAPEAHVEDPSKGPFRAEYHRRLHRPGRPRRIDADPELRAFVLNRIDVMTFEELAAAIADGFPPGRKVGKSAIHDWFHNTRR
ncbi:hypothetical protein [Phaeobacter sp. B1627]|uniref:hypothetical protein n=1 Tax=Phaeobacter sp. B1627 TaxID=2583809 RepID=UPI00111B34B1|nr:hypothetical protein [Phaeobacter sp. B1627]